MTPASRVLLVDIDERPLDLAAVTAALVDDGSGGVVWFVGRVRDTDGPGGSEKAVAGLDYTAHPTALERLRGVCEQVAATHDVRGLVAVHRTGPLAIGDVAVIVGAAAAHRADAFAATRLLIDTLKAEVPIWKHQLFADGTEEWVGLP